MSGRSAQKSRDGAVRVALGTAKDRASFRSKMRAAVDWDALDARSDAALTRAAVADADNPPLDAAFWARARVVLPAAKRPVSLRIDGDVLDWFRSRGRGYQTRINAVLRSYVQAQRR